MSLDELASRIRDGCHLAIPKDESGVAMAATKEIICQGTRDLRILCVPTSGLQADLLIGAGCVTSIECGAVTLSEFGPPVDWDVGRIDWILVDGPFSVRSIETVIDHDKGRYPSDHYPVTAHLEFEH